jgi:hypothetical protein
MLLISNFLQVSRAPPHPPPVAAPRTFAWQLPPGYRSTISYTQQMYLYSSSYGFVRYSPIKRIAPKENISLTNHLLPKSVLALTLGLLMAGAAVAQITLPPTNPTPDGSGGGGGGNPNPGCTDGSCLVAVHLR